jgi:hypothetical protein
MFYHLIQRVKKDFPLINIFSFDSTNYKILPSPEGFGLNRMLNLSLKMDDYKVTLLRRTPPIRMNKMIEHNGKEEKVSWKLNVYIGKAKTIINSTKPYTVLVFRDSFMGKMSPFMNQTFGKSIYYHFNSLEGEDLTALVNEHNPDLVIYEFVERLFGEGKHLLHENIRNMLDISLYNERQTITGMEIYNNARYFKGIKEKKIVGNDIFLAVSNTDPQIGLPKLSNIEQDAKVLLAIDITVPGNTRLTIFYKTEKQQAYSRKRKVYKEVKTGRNRVLLFLPDEDISLSNLRLDPGSLRGEYIIHSIEVLAKKINRNEIMSAVQ